MRKIYSLVLMAVGLLIGTNAGAQETPTWPQTFENDEAAVAAGAVAKIDNQYYATLKSAFAAAPASTETMVTLLKDISESGISVSANQNIIFELNGKVLSLESEDISAIITNQGQLTIQDNTDFLSDFVNPFTKDVIKQYRGSGTGKIIHIASNPDLDPVPGRATNTITNKGTLTVKSGTIDNQSVGTASYAIDNPNVAYKLNISGGKITSNKSYTIRMWITSASNIVNITGGIVDRIWVQDGAATDNGTLTIENTSMIGGANIGYEEASEHFSVSITNCDVQGTIIYAFDPLAEGNSITVDKLAAKMFVMPRAKKILSNGIFNFNGDEINMGWVIHDDGYYDKYYSTSKGYRWGTPTSGEWETAYLSPEANLHMFYDYIVDGYGLVPRHDLNVNEGDNWYEIVLAQGTTEEEAPQHDGELGNPWHQNKTWDLTKENVVPVETTPVLIDHNVFVEENTQAVAASLQIEAGQTLTVKSGATLQIQDAGALFKDETAQLVVEPNAVVTVGANGVIADNVDNIIIKASETEQGVFMCHPDVKLNTQPKATVYLYTKAKQIRSNPYEYIYQRFAIPTSDGEATVYGDNYTSQELFAGEPKYIDAVYGWDNTNLDWKMLDRWQDMKSFVGYQVTNNTKDGGITYSFKGNLVGNHDGNFEFAYHPEGFQFFGNSYTAPIYIPTFLDSIARNNSGVQQSIWIYDEGADNFKPVTKIQAEYGLVAYDNGEPIKEIRSMQAFILSGHEGNVTDLSYADAIWGNPRFNGRLDDTEKAPRRAKTLDITMATISVKADNGQADEVSVFESNEFTQDFDNGADASKYMYAEGINLYANTTIGKQTNVASDNVEGTILGFRAGVSENYTIRFSNINGDEFTLIDLENQQRVEMKADVTYSFSQTAKSTNEARFMIVRKAPSVTTDMDELNNANSTIKVVENGHLIVIKNGVRYNALGEKL